MKKKGKTKRKETEETKWKLGEETSKRKHVTDSSSVRLQIVIPSFHFPRDLPAIPLRETALVAKRRDEETNWIGTRFILVASFTLESMPIVTRAIVR